MMNDEDIKVGKITGVNYPGESILAMYLHHQVQDVQTHKHRRQNQFKGFVYALWMRERAPVPFTQTMATSNCALVVVKWWSLTSNDRQAIQTGSVSQAIRKLVTDLSQFCNANSTLYVRVHIWINDFKELMADVLRFVVSVSSNMLYNMKIANFKRNTEFLNLVYLL